MENGAFAPKEQMLHFPYFQIHDILKGVKRYYYGVKGYCLCLSVMVYCYNNCLSHPPVTIIEPRHEISNNVVSATSKGSDQPARIAQSDQNLC